MSVYLANLTTSTLGTFFGGGSGGGGVPANALLDETSNPILDESGDYILAD